MRFKGHWTNRRDQINRVLCLQERAGLNFNVFRNYGHSFVLKVEYGGARPFLAAKTHHIQKESVGERMKVLT